MNSSEKARDIFLHALDQSTEDARRQYLDSACGNNAPLRAHIERLLAANVAAEHFLEGPPPGLALTVVSDQDDNQEFEEGASFSFLNPSPKPGCMGTLRHYEVVGVVGRGACGIVFRAYDTRLNRIVAIKVMAPELATNPTAVKRFSREAQAAAAVQHDHVVTIHAIEETSTPPFIVMEYVDGESLKEKVERDGQLDVVEILRIGNQMAAGLGAAHRQGLVHRDIKPANILLENGIRRVKITDFGLARAVDDIGMTQTGTIAGTPQFMSPEQGLGRPIDGRSDLFSLGSVLYTLCTGRAPFRADSTVATLKRVCDDDPRSMREVNPDIPEWLEHVILRLLEKDPARRFQSADEVAEIFRACLIHVQSHAAGTVPSVVAVTQDKPGRKTAPRSLAHALFSAAVVVQLLGLVGTTLAAMAKGETIVFTGPVFGVGLGLLIAGLAWRAGLDWQCTGFGLSSVFCAIGVWLMILLNNLGPNDSEWVGTIAIYAMLAIPWGIYLLLRNPPLANQTAVRSSWSMLQSQEVFAGLMSVQILGLALSVALSPVEPESVVVTGPVFFLLFGLLLSAVVLAKPHLTITRVFAMSAPVAVLLLYISLTSTSMPFEGSAAFLIGYGFVAVPLGFWALVRQSNLLQDPKFSRFSIRSMLVATAVLGAAFTLSRPSLGFGLGAYLASLVFSLALIGMVSFWALWLFEREKKPVPGKWFALAIAALLLAALFMGGVSWYERSENVGHLAILSATGQSLAAPVQIEIVNNSEKTSESFVTSRVGRSFARVHVGDVEVRVVGDVGYRAVPSHFKLERRKTVTVLLEKLAKAPATQDDVE